VQKRLNLSIRRFDCGLEWAEGCTSSIVFARWRQCAFVEGHVAVTCRITLNHPCTAAMRLMANYFGHLLFFGHADLHSRTDSQALRAEYCIVGIVKLKFLAARISDLVSCMVQRRNHVFKV